jgi:hypothetical protein
MIGVLGFVVTGPQIELAGFIREPCQRSGCRATFYAWKAAAEPRAATPHRLAWGRSAGYDSEVA